MRRPAIVFPLAPLAFVACVLALQGCGREPDPTDGPSLSITVAPLALAGITDATYTISVETLGGDLVWSQTVTSSRYGDGRGGLAYVGPCDATPSDNPNTVTLTLIALAGTAGEPVDAGSWRDPGPITREVVCRPDADTPVAFDLTILRDAGQGFFDVGVTFSDIFCSAKLDCVDALLHDATGARGPTAVAAFACTAGPGQDTTLYWGEAAIVCRDGATVRATYPIDLARASGQHGPIGAPPGTTPPGVYESAIYRGAEDLAGVDKCYWNIALGLDVAALGPSCTFEATATAADAPFTEPPFSTPPGAVYPIIRWDVPLTGAGGALVCGEHALDEGLVTTGYAPPTGAPLAYRAGCDDPTPTTPETVAVEVTLSVVDDAGAPLTGLTYAPADGAPATLPLTTLAPTGDPIGGDLIACDGALPLPPSAMPTPDTTLTITLPAGTTVATPTPGVSAIVLVVPQHHPIAWWRFEDATDAPTLRRDVMHGWTCAAGPAIDRQRDGAVGHAVDFVGTGPVEARTPVLMPCYNRFADEMQPEQRPWLTAGSITIEVLFENTRLLEVGSYARLFLLSGRLELHYFEGSFYTIISRGGLRSGHYFVLDGVGAKSASRYHAGWHHLALTYDAATRELRLWLDGVNPDGFVHTFDAVAPLDAARDLHLGGDDLTPFDGTLDELAVYDRALPAGLIHQHAVDALDAGRPYSACERPVTLPPTDLDQPLTGHDSRHVAPGYPSYDAQGTNPDARTPLAQLRHFQAPRYALGHTLPPQWSWMGGNYIAGYQTGVTGPALVQAEVDVMEELATFWGYGVKVTDNASRDTPVAAKVALANDHPEWPTFAIGLWPQTFPAQIPDAFDAADHAYLTGKGMALMSVPFIRGSTTTLSPDHFPNDGVTRLADMQSPVAPLETWALDGKAMAYQVQRFLDALTPRVAAGANAIDHYNENGEVVKTWQIPMAALRGDPLIVDDLEAWDPSAVDRTTTPPTLDAEKAALYLGHAESRINNAFLGPMRAKPEMADTVFTYYGLDGNRYSRPRYEEVRKTMTPIDGTYRATPDLYPRIPRWAHHGESAWHGYAWLGVARWFEIAAGDKHYWPFVAAGWANEPFSNLLPGQWLGLLKVTAALGADSWFPAFFSLSSPFPEPEGWVWQAATASYAHAITSRYEDILRQGDLVVARSAIHPFGMGRFYDDYFSLYTKAATSEIVVARRMGDVWLFAGTIQPKSNYAGTQELYRRSPVHVDWTGDGVTEVITLPIRRQGSVYRWDRTGPTPTLVQLDRWHEVWHPWWWSRDFRFDAEVHDGLVAGSGKAWTIHTDAPDAPDYSEHTTSLRVEPADATTWTPSGAPGTALLANAPAARYAFQPRATGDVHAWIRARVRDDGTAVVYLTVAEGTAGEQAAEIEVEGDAWAWYHVSAGGLPAQFVALAASEHLAPAGMPHETTRHILTVRPGYAQVEIDQVLLAASPTRDPTSDPPESELTEVGDLP